MKLACVPPPLQLKMPALETAFMQKEENSQGSATAYKQAYKNPEEWIRRIPRLLSLSCLMNT